MTTDTPGDGFVKAVEALNSVDVPLTVDDGFRLLVTVLANLADTAAENGYEEIAGAVALIGLDVIHLRNMLARSLHNSELRQNDERDFFRYVLGVDRI